MHIHKGFKKKIKIDAVSPFALLSIHLQDQLLSVAFDDVGLDLG